LSRLATPANPDQCVQIKHDVLPALENHEQKFMNKMRVRSSALGRQSGGWLASQPASAGWLAGKLSWLGGWLAS